MKSTFSPQTAPISTKQTKIEISARCVISHPPIILHLPTRSPNHLPQNHTESHLFYWSKQLPWEFKFVFGFSFYPYLSQQAHLLLLFPNYQLHMSVTATPSLFEINAAAAMRDYKIDPHIGIFTTPIPSIPFPFRRLQDDQRCQWSSCHLG